MRTFKRKQKGFTLVEAMISMTLFTALMGMGFNFYSRTHSTMKLTESEAKMQMYSRQAMTKITKELRQASDYYEIPFDGIPQAKEILFVHPDDANQGTVQRYLLVRYWFHENAQGVYSLMRAYQDHGDQARFLNGDNQFSPDANDSGDVQNYHISALVKEATVIEPGKQSFFQQDKSNPGIINLRMVTATYGAKTSNDISNRSQEVKRQFRIDTAIQARNLQL